MVEKEISLDKNNAQSVRMSSSKKDLPPGKAVRWKENRYIPTAPVLRTPEEKTLFLDYLRESRVMRIWLRRNTGLMQEQ